MTTLGDRRRPAVVVVAGLLLSACTAGCSAAVDPSPPPSPSVAHRDAPSATPSASTPPQSAAAPSPPADANRPFHPEVGQCIDARKDRQSGPESIVPCEVEHDDEAFATFMLDGVDYPGELEMEALATEACRARLGDFIGIPYSESVYEVVATHPTAESWQAHGDRKVTCLVWYPADSVVGSLAGAGS
ncbi:hypothetical protein ABIC29_002576 [Agromyces sp. PvR057]